MLLMLEYMIQTLVSMFLGSQFSKSKLVGSLESSLFEVVRTPSVS